MKTAPRILFQSHSNSRLPAAEDGFTALVLAPAADRSALADLARQAKEAGLRLITQMPADAADAQSRLARDLDAGIRGFLVSSLHHVSPAQWAALIAASRKQDPDCWFIADFLGARAIEVLSVRGSGFDYVLNSVRWWDGAAPWFLDQYAMTLPIAGSIGFPQAPGEAATDTQDDPYRRRLLLAATLSAGLLVTEDGLDRPGRRDLIAAINRMKRQSPALSQDGPMRRLSEIGAAVTVILRESPAGDDGVLALINTSADAQDIDADLALGRIGGQGREFREITPGAEESWLAPGTVTLAGREMRVLSVRPAAPEIVAGEDLPRMVGVPHVVIERVTPLIDGGAHPVKRIIGDRLEVSADLFRDGHDRIAASLWLQPAGTQAWRVTPMRPLDNDRWAGSARLDHVGPTRFAVSGWTDFFASWRHETIAKREAGTMLDLDLAEGRQLIAAAVARAAGQERERLAAILAASDRLEATEPRAQFLLSNRVAQALARVPDRHDLVFQDPPGLVTVDREAARFSAWYGMFPRSQGTEPDRPARFADCSRRLPEIRALGFDVIYLVPIHPIGTINRKGRNNSVTAGPGEPGSPYAIGSTAGGHTAIDPELGTIEDFRAFIQAARDHNLEVALDFAVQCAPDHPWLTEHPGWFKRRLDHSIKFAENPPKKYQDIVNVDFDQADWPALWAALLEIVRFWIAQGVRIFRVDNPHTKPVAFWAWLIAEIRQTDPQVLFLAEAFTRPKVMQHLAKIGFSQSYSYFTWRNTKDELTQYLTELTRSEQVEYFRPVFFPNTPDILPWFLQQGGRAGFRIRLVLAATLSPAYGIYNGFELCEAEAVPGKEEYLNSEKYQYKAWDWDRPGHIKDDIVAMNRLRRASPALRLFDTLRFHEAGHGDVLFYSKIAPDRSDAVLVAVTLDPKHVVRTEIAFPLNELGLLDGAEFDTVDAFTGDKRRWSGARHWIVLDPQTNPALVLHFRPEFQAS